MLSWIEVEHNLDFWGALFKLWGYDADHNPIYWTFNIGGYEAVFWPRVMIMTWLVMIIVLALAVAATRNMDLRHPKGLQNVFEFAYLGIQGLVHQAMDTEKGKAVTQFAFALILFIATCNLIGLVPTMAAPTADLNTTAGLALISFVLTWYYGIRYKGIGYFKHWFKPVVFFLPLNLLEEFVKPVTLAARLFGNIYAKEILICTWLGMFMGTWQFGVGIIASVAWLAFSVFISLIQAFVFCVLTINYIGMATADDH